MSIGARGRDISRRKVAGGAHGRAPGVTLPPGGRSPALLAVAAACLLAGCGAKPPAALSNQVLVPEEAYQKRTLSDADRARAIATLDALATGHVPSQYPQPAPGPAGVRWTDVPLAVREAVGEEGVEMAILQRIDGDGTYTFVLRTIEDWPAELVIRRTYDEDVYNVERISIGRFPDEPARIERGELLLKEFRRHLERLGKQRQYPK